MRMWTWKIKNFHEFIWRRQVGDRISVFHLGASLEPKTHGKENRIPYFSSVLGRNGDRMLATVYRALPVRQALCEHFTNDIPWNARIDPVKMALLVPMRQQRKASLGWMIWPNLVSEWSQSVNSALTRLWCSSVWELNGPHVLILVTDSLEFIRKPDRDGRQEHCPL